MNVALKEQRVPQDALLLQGYTLKTLSQMAEVWASNVPYSQHQLAVSVWQRRFLVLQLE
jgi:hypothetical protein